jgi:uncharacterized membrane protein
MNVLRVCYMASVASLTALIALCVAWELWLAPLRPGGSWIVLKVLPLLTPLFGILRARLYTYQWAAMLMVAYFVEGVVRSFAEPGLRAALASLEIALAVTFIVSAAAFVRASSRSASKRATPGD